MRVIILECTEINGSTFTIDFVITVANNRFYLIYKGYGQIVIIIDQYMKNAKIPCHRTKKSPK